MGECQASPSHFLLHSLPPCKCSDEQSNRIINVAVPFSSHNTRTENTHTRERESAELSRELRPLNKRQCRFENGFNVAQNRRTCSLAREPQTAQPSPTQAWPTSTSYWPAAHSGSRVRLANQGACGVQSSLSPLQPLSRVLSDSHVAPVQVGPY